MKTLEKNTKQQQLVRLPIELASILKEMAERENRTFPNMTAVLVKEALAQRGIQVN